MTLVALPRPDFNIHGDIPFFGVAQRCRIHCD